MRPWMAPGQSSSLWYIKTIRIKFKLGEKAYNHLVQRDDSAPSLKICFLQVIVLQARSHQGFFWVFFLLQTMSKMRQRGIAWRPIMLVLVHQSQRSYKNLKTSFIWNGCNNFIDSFLCFLWRFSERDANFPLNFPAAPHPECSTWNHFPSLKHFFFDDSSGYTQNSPKNESFVCLLGLGLGFVRVCLFALLWGAERESLELIGWNVFDYLFQWRKKTRLCCWM